jgi:hypothetical protein
MGAEMVQFMGFFDEVPLYLIQHCDRHFMNHTVKEVCMIRGNSTVCSAYTLQTLFLMLANWGTLTSQRDPCLSTVLQVYIPVNKLIPE